MSDWIRNLMPGDKVIFDGRVRLVDKVGKLHVIVGGCKFRKNSGENVDSHDWDRRCIYEWSLAKEESCRADTLYHNNVKRLRYQAWGVLSRELVAQVVALIEGGNEAGGG